MSGIRTYEITVPPTSSEVGELVFNAIRNRGYVNITGRPETAEIGPNDEVELAVQIRSTLHRENAGMRILGETATGNTINIQLSGEPGEPASFTIPFEFDEQA